MAQRHSGFFCRHKIVNLHNAVKVGKCLSLIKNLSTIYMFIEYQNKKHAFNWLNTLHVTFTIRRYRLGC